MVLMIDIGGVRNERRVVFINQKDMERFGLSKLESVNLVSTYNGERRIVHNFFSCSL
jgi:predicted RNA-binding protein Jag